MVSENNQAQRDETQPITYEQINSSLRFSKENALTVTKVYISEGPSGGAHERQAFLVLINKARDTWPGIELSWRRNQPGG